MAKTLGASDLLHAPLPAALRIPLGSALSRQSSVQFDLASGALLEANRAAAWRGTRTHRRLRLLGAQFAMRTMV